MTRDQALRWAQLAPQWLGGRVEDRGGGVAAEPRQGNTKIGLRARALGRERVRCSLVLASKHDSLETESCCKLPTGAPDHA